MRQNAEGSIVRRQAVTAATIALGLGLGLVPTTTTVHAASPPTLQGPAQVVTLDRSGRTVTLDATNLTADEFAACSAGSTAVVHCGARRIDRLTGAGTDLPDFVKISSDQTALITRDRRWLDLETLRTTAVPAAMSLDFGAPFSFSADGRTYAGANAPRTAGWLVDAESGAARPLPIPGAPLAMSSSGRFVLVSSVHHCQGPNPAAGLCDQYVWDTALGALILVARADLGERASAPTSDGTVFVSSGLDSASTSFRRQPLGGAASPLIPPAGSSASLIASTSDDGSIIEFLQNFGSAGPLHLFVDAATGAVLAQFNTTTRPEFHAVTSWALSADGSTLATMNRVGDGVWLGEKPALKFETLRSPSARLRALEEHAVVVAGTAGVPVDASAVMLNVTVTDPASDGFVTVWPCGQLRPLASNGNFVAGQTVATATVSRVGSGGTVCVASNAAVNVVVDVQGWFGPGSPYQALTPTRLLDTRVGAGTSSGALTSAAGTMLPVAGAAGIGAGATTVALNVTALGAPADGFVVVWPCGEPRPTTSSLNVRAGATVANLVITRVGTGGQVCLASNATADLVVDAEGWFADDGAYTSVDPVRLTDTRAGEQDTAGNLPPTTVLTVATPVAAGGAAMVNVTVTNPASAGFATVWPCSEAQPLASNLNFTAGQTVANAVLAKVDPSGKVCIASNVTIDVVVDHVGSFGAASPYHPLVPARVDDTRIIVTT